MRLAIMGAACLAALGLQACGTTGLSAKNVDGSSQLLSNLEHCDRTYIGGVGGIMPPNVQVSISCRPQAAVDQQDLSALIAKTVREEVAKALASPPT